MSAAITQRLGGLDLARGLAVLGMVAVNFGLLLSGEAAMSSKQDVWARLLSFPAGDASATFVVLAGVGIGLRVRSDGEESSRRRAFLGELARRALTLVVLGTVHFIVWPPDIIHLSGFMMLASLPLLHVRRTVLASLAVVVVLGYVFLLGSLDYERGWDFATLTYRDTTLVGHVRRIFFNGFHPIVPWIGFLWMGIVIGRGGFDGNLSRRAWRYLTGGVGIASVAGALSRSAQRRTADPDLKALLGVESIPPGPLYMAFAGGVALSLIGVGLLFDCHPALGRWLAPLRSLGQLALTAYFAHVAVGLALLLLLAGLAPAWVALVATVAFSVAAMIAAHVTITRGLQGPLERLVRRIAKSR